jgi:hypothetical protein
MAEGKLRLFHLGRIDSLPSFRSLEFLLKVFPKLSDAGTGATGTGGRGRDSPERKVRAIQKLSAKYPAGALGRIST